MSIACWWVSQQQADKPVVSQVGLAMEGIGESRQRLGALPPPILALMAAEYRNALPDGPLSLKTPIREILAVY